MKPTVTSFLDTILKGEYYDLVLDEVVVRPHSSFVEKTLQETKISQEIGVNIPAIKSSQHGKLVLNPGPKTKIYSDDVFIVFGTPEQIRQLTKRCM